MDFDHALTQARPTLYTGDCLDIMRAWPDDCVDLVFTSPPYEAARTYGIGFNLRGQDWVDWAVARYLECLRVSRGLVAWVVEGQTRDFRWSATPALLMADLHRRAIHLRKPPIYARSGIPESGGPDWLRNDYEFIVCAGPGGKLPWSDNTAMGKPPKCPPGGDPTNRKADGRRVRMVMKIAPDKYGSGSRYTDRGSVVTESQSYKPPTIANPGNIVRCSGGHLGSPLAHENEAPFPEALAEFFVKSFCPPDGIVLDPFCGSGTTLAVAARCGRLWAGIDVRESQIELTARRLGDAYDRVP